MKPLQKIINPHLKKLQKYIAGVIIEPEEEEIHQLRVSFKKLRAITRLSGKLKLSKSLKELFAAAGKVRELQLVKKQLLSVYSVTELPHYYAELNQQLIIAVNTLKEKAVYDYKTELEQIVTNCPEKITAEKILHFIEKNVAGITHVVQLKSKTEEQIHDARKLLKDLQYVIQSLEEAGPHKTTILAAGEKEQLHRMSDELGMFQDQCTMLSYLSLPALRSLPGKENSLLKNFRSRLLKEKRDKKKIVLQQLTEMDNTLLKKEWWKTL